MDRWLTGYLGSLMRRPRTGSGVRHLMVAVCDHYEPYRDGVDAATARGHVARWVKGLPGLAQAFRDADGRMPQHTFFYPEEEYDPACLDGLGTLMEQGCGEVEIHLHHRNDTAAGLREKLVRFRDVLHREHGMLGCRRSEGGDRRSEIGGRRSEIGDQTTPSLPPTPDRCPPTSDLRLPTADSRPPSSDLRPPVYAFIHGNWALCNSRPDRDWCGVNEELGVLAETGCYADLTFPSAPSPTQPRMVNAIYRAWDRPQGRGHDRGRRSEVRSQRSEGGDPISDFRFPTSDLLLIQGPLALNFARRKWGVLPRIENGEISGSNWPTMDRARLWARTGIHVAGRPEWVFAKLHTHGCVPANSDVLLGAPMRAMHTALQQQFNDGTNWQLHYVTAREMTNIILAAEAGHSGNPGAYRDYAIERPRRGKG